MKRAPLRTVLQTMPSLYIRRLLLAHHYAFTPEIMYAYEINSFVVGIDAFYGFSMGWRFQRRPVGGRKTHKMILVNFSGSDWCAPCIRLRKEILETAVFEKYAAEYLVLVRADFPRQEKNRLDKDQVKRNESLENRLIEDSEPLDFMKLVTDKVQHFQELLSAQPIQVITDLQGRPIKASRYLVDILLNNLFSNAIRHNHPLGKIHLTLSGTRFVCENSGMQTVLNADTIFDRFQKGHKSEGTGLGLAIVKNVCHLYNWELRYYFHDGMHAFEIIF